MKSLLAWTALAVCAHVACAGAQVRNSGYELPLTLALDAANEALKSCEAAGYKVSVAVVDPSGELRAFVKGDHATVHTKETSFRKAYTTVTLGPLFGFDALGAFVDKAKSNPAASSFLTVPNIILLPGAVAIRAKGEIVAAIGVGGAPGGDKDEVCAAAGAAAIRQKLPAAN
ncbi:heme-binding protein [Bosea sp. 124]|uniref:GlcG/HbpS family heme-binding protein n=1 Tax=Bosea sp. 124 TaxID=2135642 RepID=UPI000D36221C|nr:heme-binding protein [Bosea sp. 124]PTM43509.1 uncharacterized protein GlcG (DUF336 family) [Bosea sp. 124]